MSVPLEPIIAVLMLIAQILPAHTDALAIADTRGLDLRAVELVKYILLQTTFYRPILESDIHSNFEKISSSTKHNISHLNLIFNISLILKILVFVHSNYSCHIILSG